eukprot:1182066-Prorocentrum_minimum.AAC.2
MTQTALRVEICPMAARRDTTRLRANRDTTNRVSDDGNIPRARPIARQTTGIYPVHDQSGVRRQEHPHRDDGGKLAQHA